MLVDSESSVQALAVEAVGDMMSDQTSSIKTAKTRMPVLGLGKLLIVLAVGNETQAV
jgi:hypothetical protein